MKVYSQIGDASDNKLKGSNNGLNYLAGREGDDTYIVQNLGNTVTYIDDTVIAARPDDDSFEFWQKYLGGKQGFVPNYDVTNNGNDTLQINNINANDLFLFFDVFNKNAKDGNIDGDVEIKDALFIFKKSAVNSVKTQLSKSFSGKLPSNGVVRINAFFSDSVNAEDDNSINYAENRIETIKVYQNGVEKVVDIEKYFSETQSKVRNILEKYGYTLASEMLMKANTKQRNELLDCYKTPMDLIITGTKNDDKMYAEAGNDTFIFNADSGNDIIYNSNINDKLVFQDAEVSFLMKNGNNLCINYSSESGTSNVILSNYYKMKAKDRLDSYTDKTGEHSIKEQVITVEGQGKIYGTEYDDIVEGSMKADIIYGGGGNDKLYGDWGNDIIYSQSQIGKTVLLAGEEGNDKLYAGAGEDVFCFGEAIENGEGKDIIYNADSNDKLRFVDIDFNDLKFTKSGNDLVITVPNASGLENMNARIAYGNFQAILSNYYKNNDKLDKIEFVKMEDPDNVTTASISDAKIYISGSGRISDTDFDDIITGSKKADKIVASKGNDTVIAGKGNDTITLGAGDKTFNFSNGDGNDTIYVGDDTNSVKLNFADVNESGSLSCTKNNNDLVITHSYLNKNNVLVSGGTVTIKNYFFETGDVRYNNISISKDKVTYSNLTDLVQTELNIAGVYSKKYKANIFVGTDFNDIITGSTKVDNVTTGAGNDVITTGKGNDTITLGAGDKCLNFSSGDGNDTIYVGDDTNSVKLNFANMNENGSLSYAKNNDDLTITHSYLNKKGVLISGGTVTIKNYFNDEWQIKYNNISISKDSDTYYNLADLVQSGLNITGIYDKKNKETEYVGTDYNDILTYKSGVANMSGGKGDDIYNVDMNKNTNVHISDINESTGIGGGNDTLNIGATKDNLAILFNVNSDGFVYENNAKWDSDMQESFDSLYIFNKNSLTTNNLMNYLKGKSVNGIIEINNFFSEDGSNNQDGAIFRKDEHGYIENFNVKSKDGSYVNVDMEQWIKQVAGEVANWMNDHSDYSSAADVFAQGNMTDINSLIKVYQTGSYQAK